MTFLSADRILKNANLIRQMLGYSSGVSYETSSQKVNIARLERKREELRREREISAGIRGQAEGCGQAHDTISELRLRAAEWAKMKVRSEERNEQLHADLERLIKDVSESHPCNRRLARLPGPGAGELELQPAKVPAPNVAGAVHFGRSCSNRQTPF